MSRPLAAGIVAIAAIAAPANAGTVSGTVYIDRDGSGSLSPGDTAAEGIAVFWETATVGVTDGAGRYRLEVPERGGIVWARAESDHEPRPVYQAIEAGDRDDVDLGLRPVEPGRRAAFIHASDTHIGLRERGLDRRLSGADVAHAIEQAIDPAAPPLFVVVTGDLVAASDPAEYEELRRAVAAMPLPFVPVPGNHDWYDGGLAYRAALGPPMYSFTAAGHRFVVLNDNGDTAAWQRFLALDRAAGIETGTSRIAFIHKPPTDPELAALERAGIGALFTGHWHTNFIVERGALVEHNTEPFSRGGTDSTPGGYRIVELTAGGLEIAHHNVVASGHAEIVFPRGAVCAPDPLPVIAAVELGAGVAGVNAERGGRPIELAAAGGWSFTGTLAGGGGSQVRLRARRGGAVLRREVSFSRCRARAPRVADWRQLGGNARHRGRSETAIAPPLATLWARAVGGHIHGGSPVVAGGRVFVAATDFGGTRSAVVALDAATGAIVWRRPTHQPVRSAPAAGRGLLVYGRADGIIEAVDAATGALRWRRDLGAGLAANESILHAAPTIDGGVVFAGVHRRFAALALETGEVLWERDPATRGTLTSLSSPAVGGGLVVATVARGRDGVFAYDRRTGEEQWRLPGELALGTHASPLIDGDTVYLIDGAGVVRSAALADGALRWSAATTDGATAWDYAVVATPALAGGKLIVGTQYDQLIALDAATGEHAWRIAAGESPLYATHSRTIARAFPAAPAIAGNVLWVGGADGLLRALDPKSGDERWRADLGAPITSGVVPAGEILLVATYDGTLRAMIAHPAPRRSSPSPYASLVAAFVLALFAGALWPRLKRLRWRAFRARRSPRRSPPRRRRDSET